MNKFKLLVVVFFILSGQVLAEPNRVGYKVGEQASDFELNALDGKTYTLTKLKQQGHVLLIFWATECVYCYAHIADFKKIHEQYHDKGLTLAAINIGGEYDQEVKEYVNDNALNYLVLSNRLKNLDVAEAYHVLGTPTMVLVAPAGEIVYRGYDIPQLDKWLKSAGQ